MPRKISYCSEAECDLRCYGRGLCQKHWARMYRKRTGPRPLTLEPVSYKQSHLRVAQRRGRAADAVGGCIDCGGNASQWAYNHASEREQSGWTVGKNEHLYKVTWSPDPDDYDPRCVPCHKAFDLGRSDA